MTARKKVAILGSTGSIGRQALDVVRQFPDRWEVVALAAGRSHDLLASQVMELKPAFVSCRSRCCSSKTLIASALVGRPVSP